MAKVIECGDGFLVRGASDHDLVAKAEAHLRDAHAELVGTIFRDQFLAMAEEVSP
jgi:predicted small metal-binding protein